METQTAVANTVNLIHKTYEITQILSQPITLQFRKYFNKSTIFGQFCVSGPCTAAMHLSLKY